MLDTTLKSRLQLYPRFQGCATLTHSLQRLSLALCQALQNQTQSLTSKQAQHDKVQCSGCGWRCTAAMMRHVCTLTTLCGGIGSLQTFMATYSAMPCCGYEVKSCMHSHHKR